MSNFQKNIIITSIGHFLVHAMTMILPAILVLLETEFSVSLISLGKLLTVQILFLGQMFFWELSSGSGQEELGGCLRSYAPPRFFMSRAFSFSLNLSPLVTRCVITGRWVGPSRKV